MPVPESAIVTRIELMQLAKLFGIHNENYLNELVRDFGLPQIDNNKYDWNECLKWFIKYQEMKHNKAIEKIKSDKPQDDLARKNARLKQLQIDELEGRLVDVDLVKDYWNIELSTLRTSLRGLGGVLATRLLKINDQSTIKIIIDEAIDKRLLDVANSPVRVTSRDESES